MICLLSTTVWASTINAADDISADKDQITSVTTKPLSELSLDIQVSVPATIKGLNKSIISSQISGLADNVHVDIGDYVKTGQLLLSLDCREYQYNLQQIEAGIKAARITHDLSQKNFNRNKRLKEKSNISDQLFDQSKAEFLNSQAELNRQQSQLSLAQLTIERCQIKAPFAGQITQRFVQPGQLLSPNAAVVELLQTDHLEIEALLSQSDLVSFNQTKQVYFNHEDQSYPATLRTVIAILDENNRTQQVRLRLADDIKLPVNLSGRLTWKKTGFHLPANLLSLRNQQLGVLYLGQENTVGFHVLKHAIEGKTSAIDLPADTRIIIDNRKGLVVGQGINIADEQVK